AGNNSNGFFLTRLPVIYKDKYQSELPSNVAEVLMSYPNILHVEKNIRSDKCGWYSSSRTPVQVYVSHIESANHFYVQYKDCEDQLKTLLERLDADMKDTSESISMPVSGMHCCAKFSLDGSWYRGRILECVQGKDTQSVKVFYLDFGNSEWLPHTRLSFLKMEHVEYPKMAVRCSLHDVRSDSGITEKLTSLLDKESTMTVVNRVGEVLFVQLSDERGVSIVATSVKQEEATPEKVQEREEETTPVVPAVKEEEEKPVVPLQKVQEIEDEMPVVPPEKVEEKEEETPVVPVHTTDETNKRLMKPVKPFLKMKSVSDDQEKKIPERVVIPDLEFLDIMVSTVFSTDNISVMLYGEEYTWFPNLCLYFSIENPSTPNVGEIWAIKSSELHSDAQYYRVKVLSITDDQAQLEFVDYGDTRQAPVSTLKTLPSRFLDLPFQAFTISLHGIPKTKKPQVLDKLKHHILDKPLVAEVFQRTQHKLEVEIYDTATELDVNINEVMRSLIIPDEDLLPALPKVGHQVEARISHITDTGSVFVQIPGAGLNRLEELMTDITEHYSKSTKAAEFVSQLSAGHICCAKCVDGSWYRAIILERMLDRKVKVQCVDYGNIEILPRTALREPTKVNKHVNLLPFQVSINQSVCLMKADVVPGKPCDLKTGLCCQGECRLWFGTGRLGGRWLNSVGKHGCRRRRFLNNQLAKECHLHGLEKESWTAEQTVKMNELVSEDVILEVTKHDTIPMVKLFLTTEDDQQVNIVEYIQDELSSAKSESSADGSTTDLDQAEKESSSQDDDQDDLSPDLPPPITLSRPWVDVTISDAIDPGHFMFQPLEMIKILEEMTNEMTEHYKVTSEALVSPRNGDMCAVRDDGQYYRAVVKAVLSPQQFACLPACLSVYLSAFSRHCVLICVMFMDYGNLGIHPSSDFRVLVDKFKQTPSIAVKGCLAGIQPLGSSGEWSDEAKKRFEELTWWKMLVGSVDGDQYTYDFREDLKVPLHLFDTSSDDKDINIADILLSEGLARRTEELNTEKREALAATDFSPKITDRKFKLRMFH
ncbi:hypothetical protein QZH41_018912, partial [Actinostola sp. cb2023]